MGWPYYGKCSLECFRSPKKGAHIQDLATRLKNFTQSISRKKLFLSPGDRHHPAESGSLEYSILERPASGCAELQEGEYTVLQVVDAGIGISAEDFHRKN
jgi:hypothetical protein